MPKNITTEPGTFHLEDASGNLITLNAGLQTEPDAVITIPDLKGIDQSFLTTGDTTPPQVIIGAKAFGGQCLRIYPLEGLNWLTFLPLAQGGVSNYLEFMNIGDGDKVAYVVMRVDSQVTAVPTGANTTETDAFLAAIAANTLTRDGMSAHYHVFGSAAENSNNKKIQLYVGNTVVYSTGDVAIAGDWDLEMTVLRTSSGQQLISIKGVINNVAVCKNTTTSKADTSSITLKTTLTNGVATAGELTAKGAITTLK